MSELFDEFTDNGNALFNDNQVEKIKEKQLTLLQKGVKDVDDAFRNLKSIVQFVEKDVMWKPELDKNIEKRVNDLEKKVCNLTDTVHQFHATYSVRLSEVFAMEPKFQTVYDKLAALNNLVMDAAYRRDTFDRRLSALEENIRVNSVN